MIIRNFSISDYDAVYSFWEGTDYARRGMRSLDDSREGIFKFISRNPNTCFVSEENGEILGTIFAGHDGRRGYIYHAAVAGYKRRKGIGRTLVKAALEALKAEQINKVALVAFKENADGNAFWEKLGFTERNDLVYRNLSVNENNI